MVGQSSSRRSLNTGCIIYCKTRAEEKKKCTLLVLLYTFYLSIHNHVFDGKFILAPRFFITKYYLYYVIVYAYQLKVNKVRKLDSGQISAIQIF